MRAHLLRFLRGLPVPPGLPRTLLQGGQGLPGRDHLVQGVIQVHRLVQVFPQSPGAEVGAGTTFQVLQLEAVGAPLLGLL